jgi:hypothetical protein
MTPIFIKTPGIRNDRLGALFSDPPEIEYQKVDDKEEISEDEKTKLEEFFESSTSNGEAFMSVVARAASAIQQYPLCAIFIDRAPMDEDTKARVDAGAVSVAEAEQKRLGMPQLVLYCGSEIYDLERDTIGLKWIKVVEVTHEKPAWDSDPITVYTVRVIDRSTIKSWRIEQTKDGNTVKALPEVPHKFVDEYGEPTIPVVLANAFPDGSCDFGRPSLLGPARADVAATQILSDIRWILFIVGNPLLVGKFNDVESGLTRINTNVSRYIPLENAKGTQDAESLEFIALDPAGLNLLIEMWHYFRQEAEAQGGKDAPGAVHEPLGSQQASGISKAWTFKTGQERLLFLLTRELEHAFDRVLDLVCIAFGIDPELVNIRFNTKFDMSDPAQEAEKAAGILKILAGKSPKAAAQVIYRALTAAYDDLENLPEIKQELEEADHEPPQPIIVGNNPNQKPDDKQESDDKE